MQCKYQESDFFGFKVGLLSLVVSHLQYEDDIDLLEEMFMDDVCAIKTIFRSFELVSSLKVNFSMSGIFGVNIWSPFLDL